MPVGFTPTFEVREILHMKMEHQKKLKKLFVRKTEIEFRV